LQFPLLGNSHELTDLADAASAISRIALPFSDGCAGRLVHHRCWVVIVRSCRVTPKVRPSSLSNSGFFHSIAWTRINRTLLRVWYVDAGSHCYTPDPFGAFAFVLRFCVRAVLVRASMRAAIALRRSTFGAFAFVLCFCSGLWWYEPFLSLPTLRI
jgi:hypothetical protein